GRSPRRSPPEPRRRCRLRCRSRCRRASCSPSCRTSTYRPRCRRARVCGTSPAGPTKRSRTTRARRSLPRVDFVARQWNRPAVDYDAIVIGAGHNGLTAATVMARDGMRVLLLEKNQYTGGMAATTELIRGYRHEIAGSILFPVPDEIYESLQLDAVATLE